MAHTIRDKQKLLNRVSRLKGQLEAVEKGLDEEQDCSQILHILSACRGAMDSLMAEVIERGTSCCTSSTPIRSPAPNRPRRPRI